MRILALIALLVCTMEAARACPILVEREFTIDGPGGSYGYMYASQNNQLRLPGEPSRIHYHLIVAGPWTHEISERDVKFGGGGFVCVVVLGYVAWRLYRRKDSDLSLG